MAGERPNHSINLTAQSYALGTLHASGIPAAGYFQRYVRLLSNLSKETNEHY